MDTLSSEELSKKTTKQLILYCKDNNIKGYSNKNKEEIINIINGHIANNNRQDTGKYRTNTKDQFYTNINVAKNCIDMIMEYVPRSKKYLWIEPSAGNGSFLYNLPRGIKSIGIDIDPKEENIPSSSEGKSDIIKQDFFQWNPPDTDKKIIVFGNPPFGRQSSTAKMFISKSCKFADVIAFILPKSFTKPSMSKVFHPKFHCVLSHELRKDSFVINNDKYDVPCVFQIWIKKDIDRIIEDKVKEKGFNYVKSTEDYDVAFRRVGGLAGKCYRNNDDEKTFSVQSHYFLKFDNPPETILASRRVNNTKYIDEIVDRINSHIFPSNTVGPRSLSKSEVNIVINKIIESYRG